MVKKYTDNEINKAVSWVDKYISEHGTRPDTIEIEGDSISITDFLKLNRVDGAFRSAKEFCVSNGRAPNYLRIAGYQMDKKNYTVLFDWSCGDEPIPPVTTFSDSVIHDCVERVDRWIMSSDGGKGERRPNYVRVDSNNPEMPITQFIGLEQLQDALSRADNYCNEHGEAPDVVSIAGYSLSLKPFKLLFDWECTSSKSVSVQESVENVEKYIRKNNARPDTVKVGTDILNIDNYLELPELQNALTRADNFCQTNKRPPNTVNIAGYDLQQRFFKILFNWECKAKSVSIKESIAAVDSYISEHDECPEKVRVGNNEITIDEYLKLSELQDALTRANNFCASNYRAPSNIDIAGYSLPLYSFKILFDWECTAKPPAKHKSSVNEAVSWVDKYITEHNTIPDSVEVEGESLNIDVFLKLPALENSFNNIKEWCKKHEESPETVDIAGYTMSKKNYTILYNWECKKSEEITVADSIRNVDNYIKENKERPNTVRVNGFKLGIFEYLKLTELDSALTYAKNYCLEYGKAPETITIADYTLQLEQFKILFDWKCVRAENISVKDSIKNVDNEITRTGKRPDIVKVEGKELPIHDYLQLPELQDALHRANAFCVKNKREPKKVNIAGYEMDLDNFEILFDWEADTDGSKYTNAEIQQSLENIEKFIADNNRRPNWVKMRGVEVPIADYLHIRQLKEALRDVNQYCKDNKDEPDNVNIAGYDLKIDNFKILFDWECKTKPVPSPPSPPKPEKDVIGQSDSMISSIFVNGRDMKKVNLQTLKDLKYNRIYLNHYCETLYEKNEIKTFINRCQQFGISVYYWFALFYGDGKFIVPESDNGMKRVDYYIKKINNAEKIGFKGVCVDYIRYNGTAYKHTNACRNIENTLKKLDDNTNLPICACFMPETGTANTRYYGQNIDIISRIVDTVLIMAYKGNYKTDSAWITKTMKYFGEHAHDNNRKCKVGAVLQTYRSDDDLTKLSETELYNDAIAATNGTRVREICEFRFGLTNYINHSSWIDEPIIPEPTPTPPTPPALPVEEDVKEIVSLENKSNMIFTKKTGVLKITDTNEMVVYNKLAEELEKKKNAKISIKCKTSTLQGIRLNSNNINLYDKINVILPFLGTVVPLEVKGIVKNINTPDEIELNLENITHVTPARYIETELKGETEYSYKDKGHYKIKIRLVEKVLVESDGEEPVIVEKPLANKQIIAVYKSLGHNEIISKVNVPESLRKSNIAQKDKFNKWGRYKKKIVCGIGYDPHRRQYLEYIWSTTCPQCGSDQLFWVWGRRKPLTVNPVDDKKRKFRSPIRFPGNSSIEGEFICGNCRGFWHLSGEPALYANNKLKRYEGIEPFRGVSSRSEARKLIHGNHRYNPAFNKFDYTVETKKKEGTTQHMVYKTNKDGYITIHYYGRVNMQYSLFFNGDGKHDPCSKDILLKTSHEYKLTEFKGKHVNNRTSISREGIPREYRSGNVDPTIVTLANQIFQIDAKKPAWQYNQLDLLKKLYRWVAKRDGKHIKYEGKYDFYQSPLRTYQRHVGNCCCKTDLLFHLCEAAGLVKPDKNGKYGQEGGELELYYYHVNGHVWAKVYWNNKEYDVDPTTQRGFGKVVRGYKNRRMLQKTRYPRLPFPRSGNYKI